MREARLTHRRWQVVAEITASRRTLEMESLGEGRIQHSSGSRKAAFLRREKAHERQIAHLCA
jgi:hypothetical protein